MLNVLHGTKEDSIQITFNFKSVLENHRRAVFAVVFNPLAAVLEIAR